MASGQQQKVQQQLKSGAQPTPKPTLPPTTTAPNVSLGNQGLLGNPAGAPAPGSARSLHDEIIAVFENNRITDKEYQERLDLIDVLYAYAVLPKHHACSLFLVGSSMNGFGTHSGDMDLCLMITDEQVSRGHSLAILQEILTHMQKSERFVKSVHCITGFIPILNFTDEVTKFECDLQVNNDIGMQNSNLMRWYAACDWRVRPLVIVIKMWAKFHNINSARFNTLSSYSLCLMLINYLQCGVGEYPVLPCLQELYPDYFTADIIEQTTLTISPFPPQPTNTQTIGELLLGFLEFYTLHFDYRTDVVCVRKGVRMTIDEHMEIHKTHTATTLGQAELTNEWIISGIYIEEPFNLSNTARPTYNPQVFKYVTDAFRNSYNKLKQTGMLTSILR